MATALVSSFARPVSATRSSSKTRKASGQVMTPVRMKQVQGLSSIYENLSPKAQKIVQMSLIQNKQPSQQNALGSEFAALPKPEQKSVTSIINNTYTIPSLDVIMMAKFMKFNAMTVDGMTGYEKTKRLFNGISQFFARQASSNQPIKINYLMVILHRELQRLKREIR